MSARGEMTGKACVHVDISARMHVEEESPRFTVRGRETLRETLQGEGWGCTGRGLFDKQTRYPIRRWRRVREVVLRQRWYPVAMKQMGLIDMRGGGTCARVPSGFYEA